MVKNINKIIATIIVLLVFTFILIIIYENKNNFNNSGTSVIEQIQEVFEEEIDYVALTNTITTSTMKANITIINKSYNTFLFIETSSSTGTGSGIIFGKNSDDYYFALTNNHVTVKNSGYNLQKLTAVDYLGNEYTATRYHQSADYDLAVIYFKKSIELKIVEIEKNNLTVNTEIVSLGQPKGQSNAITYGKILKFQKNTLKDTPAYQSNVKFNVIVHDAPITNGSSGGALLSINLKIAGINYAGSSTNGTGAAIPAEKINEYLRLYFYK